MVIKRAAMDGSYLKTIVGSELAGFARDIFIDYQGLLLLYHGCLCYVTSVWRLFGVVVLPVPWLCLVV